MRKVKQWMKYHKKEIIMGVVFGLTFGFLMEQ